MRKWRNIARVSATKNLSGELSVRFDASSPLLCLDSRVDIYLVPPRQDCPRCVHLSNINQTAEGKAEVCFSEINTIEVAHQLVGCNLLISSDDAKNQSRDLQEQFSDKMLIGWTLKDVNSDFVGTIVDTRDSFEQILLYVEDNNCFGDPFKQYLAPFAQDLLVELDLDKEVIVLDLPNGIFDL